MQTPTPLPVKLEPLDKLEPKQLSSWQAKNDEYTAAVVLAVRDGKTIRTLPEKDREVLLTAKIVEIAEGYFGAVNTTGPMLEACIEVVTASFAHLNIEEIKHAATMTVAGLLEVKNQPWNGFFTAAFLGEMLRAYENNRRELAKKMASETANEEIGNAIAERDEQMRAYFESEEGQSWSADFWSNKLSDWAALHFPPDGGHSMLYWLLSQEPGALYCYDWLLRSGSVTLTPNEKWEAVHVAEKIVRQGLDLYEQKKLILTPKIKDGLAAFVAAQKTGDKVSDELAKLAKLFIVGKYIIILLSS
jgi:hypothetical protein